MWERTSPPLVSVVVPMFNAASYLEAALRSAAAQSYRPLEIIAVDDGSSDASAALARAFSPEVRVIQQPNRGAGAARNAGVARSSGSYLAFLDADDVWLPDKLSTQIDHLEDHPQLDAVFCRIVEFCSEELSDAQRRRHVPRPGHHAARLASALVIRRSAFERTGGFSEQGREGFELVDWALRAEEAAVCFGTVGGVYVRRRLHETNTGVRMPRTLRTSYLRAVKQSLDRRRARGVAP